jgi:hypothetical protein
MIFDCVTSAVIDKVFSETPAAYQRVHLASLVPVDRFGNAEKSQLSPVGS